MPLAAGAGGPLASDTADRPLGLKRPRGFYGATDGDPHRDRSRNEPPRRSGGSSHGGKPRHALTSDPPKRPPSLGPRMGIRRLRDRVTPPTGHQETGKWVTAGETRPGVNPQTRVGHRTIQRDCFTVGSSRCTPPHPGSPFVDVPPPDHPLKRVVHGGRPLGPTPEESVHEAHLADRGQRNCRAVGAQQRLAA